MTALLPANSRDTRWVYATLVAYAAGYALFLPRTLLIIDEFHYVTQAMSFAAGTLALPGSLPLHPPSTLAVPSDYPPGTSLLQAPLVALMGWRGAPLLSVLALILATVATSKLLRHTGREPVFALLIPGFAGSLLFGRTAMSDVPSAAWVAIACWALVRAEAEGPKGSRERRWSFAAGFLVGSSLLFRETNAILLVPLLGGAIMRRQCDRAAAAAGAALGVALRLAGAYWLFGDPLYVRDPQYDFHVISVIHNLAPYATMSLVLVPLGAILPLAYRGPRKTELAVACYAYLVLFLLYDYGGVRESGAKGWILLTRFMVPMLPLLAWQAADVWPRWFAHARPALRARLGRVVPALLALVVISAFVVHPLLRRREQSLLPIARAIEHASEAGVPLITNQMATLKYLAPAAPRFLILRSNLTESEVTSFARRYGRLQIVFLDRTDSEMFRADAAENGAFLQVASRHCELTTVRDDTIGGMRLHVHTIAGCPR